MGGFAQLERWFIADPVTLAARVVLCALFVAAGVYKLLHPLVASTAAVNFRVIRRPSKQAGWLLGAVETAVGIALLIPVAAVAVVGCAAALALSACYAVIIARALRAGELFACNCLPGFAGVVSAAGLVRALVMLAASGLGLVGAARGVFVTAGAAVPGLGLAVAAVGLPLAVLAAASAWRAYRKLNKDIDWEVVMDARRRQDGVTW